MSQIIGKPIIEWQSPYGHKLKENLILRVYITMQKRPKKEILMTKK